MIIMLIYEKNCMYSRIVASVLLVLMIFACSGTNSAVDRSDIGIRSSIETGTIISLEPIRVKGEDTGIGALAGAGLGAIGGSTVGGGLGRAVGAVVGGTAGLVVGREAEKQVTSIKAYKFNIQLDNGQLIELIQTNELGLRSGDRVKLINGRETRLEKL